MAKKIKTDNQFGATTGTATANETKAPGDETPAVQTPTVRLKKNGEPWKQRVANGPRVVDERMVALVKLQALNLDGFILGQKVDRDTLRNTIATESKTVKAAAKMEKTLLALNPEEQAWLLKANAEKLANLDKIKAQMTAP